VSWKTVELGTVCDLQNGFAFKSNLFSADGLPILRISNIKNQRIDTNNLVFFKRESYKEKIEQYKVKPNDLLIAMSGATTGKIGFNNTNETFYLNQRVGNLKPRENLDKKYLYYFLSTQVENNLSISAGAAQPNLSTEQIKGMKIPLPSLSTQQKLVDKLDAIFAEIDKATAAAEANAKNAEALFQSYLTQVFEIESENWKELKIRDLGKVVTGNTPKTAEAENYGNFIPFVKPGDFNNDGTIDLDKQKLSEIGLSKSRVIKEKSALMVCIGATIGKCGFTEVDVVTNQQINSVTPTSQFNHKFIYLQMLTNQFQRYVNDEAGQATLPIINKSKWESLVLKFPSLTDQIEIVKKFDEVRLESDKLKLAEINKIKKLNLLKNAVLKQAFNGELVKESL
jgi:type I restriction enzyme S subunit